MGQLDVTAPAPSLADVGVTDSAARRIAWVLSQDEYRGRMLRISVSGGGCSGFQYGFTFDEDRVDGDVLIERFAKQKPPRLRPLPLRGYGLRSRGFCLAAVWGCRPGGGVGRE